MLILLIVLVAVVLLAAVLGMGGFGGYEGPVRRRIVHRRAPVRRVVTEERVVEDPYYRP